MGLLEILVVVVYLMLIGYLGFLGWRRTHSASDYLLAGRKAHPMVMALSYGAAFISTSAIVGFGGVAGLFGMSVLWLTFLNIFVGIFIAFVFLGGRTRRIGHRLDAHTFPELLGRRYDSRFIQVFAALVIFLFMPLYAAAVLIGGCEFIVVKFNIDYNVALLVFAVLVAAYVVTGGLKGVMYADALQGSIMVGGMLVLLIYTYSAVGGINQGHRTLTDMADLVPGPLQAMGHQGWTRMPQFGWGTQSSQLWWVVVGTIVLGVGIGVLAQPQLAVRFMTVKGQKELNRAVVAGGVFILFMTGVAFTVGAVSNAWFATKGRVMEGTLVRYIDQDKGHAVIEVTRPDGSTAQMPVVLTEDAPALAGVAESETPLARGRSIALVYAQGNPDQIIPTYIREAMPRWFGMLFLLTLLAAAMSTMAGQFHAIGTSIGRDVFGGLAKEGDRSILITRMGIILGIMMAVVIGYYSRGGYIVARATAIFFGLCASAFLPAFVGGLYSKRVTRPAAIASMIAGFTVTAFWLTFIKETEAKALGICNALFGSPEQPMHSLLAGRHNWPVVDPMLVALPISVAVLIVVTLLTRRPADGHLNRIFGKGDLVEPMASVPSQASR